MNFKALILRFILVLNNMCVWDDFINCHFHTLKYILQIIVILLQLRISSNCFAIIAKSLHIQKKRVLIHSEDIFGHH